MLVIITVLALLVGMSGSNVVSAQSIASQVEVRYTLDYYKEQPIVEIRAKSNVLVDDTIEARVGIYKGNILEKEYSISKTTYRYSYYNKIFLNKINDGIQRKIAVLVSTPNDSSNPLKQFVFDIYNFPLKTQILSINNHIFTYPTAINYISNSKTISNESLDFSNIINVDGLIKGNKLDLSNWYYQYYTVGESGTRFADSATLYFDKGFENSSLDYVLNKGYSFPLKFTYLDGKVYLSLKNTYYVDEVLKNYYTTNPENQYELVDNIEFNINEQINATLELNRQGVNKVNYIFSFSFTPSNVPNISNFLNLDCSNSKFCIEKSSSSLDLSNYVTYKVGE